MAKAEWGVKRLCISCGARFYDLNKSPITCPKCDTAFQAEVLLKSRRGSPEPPKVVKPDIVKSSSPQAEENINDIPEAEDDESDDTAAALLDQVEDDASNDVAAVVETPARSTE